MENDKKRTRCVNFSPEEKLTIANICSKYKNMLENKKTDHVTTEEKNRVWGVIAEEVNCMSKTVYRSAEVLRRFYENKKREVRKVAAEEKGQLNATGGGQAKVIKKDACHDVFLSIMYKKTVYGLHNDLDADAQASFGVEDTIRGATTSSAGPINIEMNEIERDYEANSVHNDIEIEEMENDGNEFSEANNWKRYKAADLKRPISLALFNDTQTLGPSQNKGRC